MSGSITGIIIEKNNFAQDIPLEECEKKEGTYVVRFQRPAATNRLESFIRFFSDLREGVTKAKDKLCDLEGELPIVISVKGHILITEKKDQFGNTQGKFTKTSKHLPVGAEEVPIYFRKSTSEASLSASQTNKASDPSALGEKIATPLPEIGNLPPLGTVQQAPTFANQAPQPPSSAADSVVAPIYNPSAPPAPENNTLPAPPHHNTSEGLTAPEQNEALQSLTKHSSTLSEDNTTSPLPDFQQPATAPVLSQQAHDVPPPPPPLGGLNSPNNSSAKEPGTSQDSKRPSLQSQNEAIKTPFEQMNDQILKGFKLRRTGVNPEITLEGDATSAPRSPIESLPSNFKQTASTPVLPQQAHDVALPSEQLTAPEQKHAPQNLRQPLTLPPQDYPSPLPSKFQQPAAPVVSRQPPVAPPPVPPAPPPPLSEPSVLTNGNANLPSPSLGSPATSLQEEIAKKASELKKAPEKAEAQKGKNSGLNSLTNNPQVEALIKRRKAIEGKDGSDDGDVWDHETT